MSTTPPKNEGTLTVPPRWSIGVYAGACFALLVLFAQTARLNHQSLELNARFLKASQLREQLICLDEARTMSALLAASTGDHRWVVRYNSQIFDFNTHLDEMGRLLVWDEDKLTLQELKQMESRLEELERQVFTLITSGQGREAMQLFERTAYVTLKNDLAQRIRDLDVKEIEAARTNLRVSRNTTLALQVAVGLTMLALLWWWLIIRQKLRHRQQLLAATIASNERREDENQRQNQLLQQLAEHSPVAIAMLDQHFNFLLTSKQWRTILHLEGRPLTGVNYFELFPLDHDRRQAVEKVILGVPDICEGQAVRTTGGERWYRWENQPWYHQDGRTGGLVMFLEDITRRKSLEKTAQLSETRYRVLLENMPDYFHELDLKGRVLFTNRPWLGLENGTYLDDQIPARDLVQVKSAFSLTATTKVTQTLDLAFNQDGKEVFFRLRFTAILLDDAVKGVLLICSDISSEKRAITAMFHAQSVLERRVNERTAELANANEEVKTFAYIISHDLRAPLVNIRGFVSELRLALNTVLPYASAALPTLTQVEREALTHAIHEEIPEALSFIDSSVGRMGQLVSSVLRLSHLGRKELHLEHVNIAEVVDQCLKSLAFQIEQHHVKITVESLPTLISDTTAMSQIFGNLITNAVTYDEPGRASTVKIGGVKEEKRVRFWVEDTGRGIEEEDIPKVFELFRRVGRQDHAGEGMGMAYVKALVTRLGGTIECHSQLGIGTRFEFTIAEIEVSSP